MPSAQDFVAAEAQIQRSLATVDGVRVDIGRERGRPTIGGGPFAGVIRSGMEQSDGDLVAVQRLGADLVAEVRRRRLACEGYAADMRRYGFLHADWLQADQAHRASLGTDVVVPAPGPAPVRPLPPFPGAEPW
jgi:hypothetical protein